jgi:hypothetical protein
LEGRASRHRGYLDKNTEVINRHADDITAIEGRVLSLADKVCCCGERSPTRRRGSQDKPIVVSDAEEDSNDSSYHEAPVAPAEGNEVVEAAAEDRGEVDRVNDTVGPALPMGDVMVLPACLREETQVKTCCSGPSRDKVGPPMGLIPEALHQELFPEKTLIPIKEDVPMEWDSKSAAAKRAAVHLQRCRTRKVFRRIEHRMSTVPRARHNRPNTSRQSGGHQRRSSGPEPSSGVDDDVDSYLTTGGDNGSAFRFGPKA